MKKQLTVELNEEDIKKLIQEHIAKNYNFSVKDMVFFTSVRGDYDKGDAEEFVKKVICNCVVNYS